jgi:DNA polymerase III alpha subunit
VLWYDGDSAYTPASLLRAITTRDVKYVTEPSPLVDEYNKHATAVQEIRVKDNCRPLTKEWTIPDQYKTLDVVEYLFRAHDVLFEGLPEHELSMRERRLAQELVIYQKYKLDDVIRAIIWIINTLTATDTVWGVGRGSSVSSYVLYVIGVHDVDSYAYNLDIDDFLHE